MKKLLCILLCTTLLTIFGSGCAFVEMSSGIFDYTTRDAEFAMSFSSDSGTVECLVKKTGEKIHLSVTAPEEMRSFAVEIVGEDCVITSSAKPIPVSKEASRGLTSIFSVIYRGDNEVVSVKKSSDGLSTVINYADGAVMLGEDNLPIAVSAPQMDGKMRNVSIPWYKSYTENNN